MNFFQQQAHARKQTGLLVLLFLGAVLGIVAAVNLAVGLFLVAQTGLAESQGDAIGWQLASLDPAMFVAISAVTLGLIAGGTLWKLGQLARGGKAVAAMVGARPLEHDTTDPGERRLLNVVAEMAIASGTPAPTVYLMDDEAGINAFAAGYTPNEAVIAVTRGALDTLSRDELQGVIAHEFSHIFNGDMRLNLRLIGILHGILLIGLIGSGLLRTFARGGNLRYRGRGKQSPLPLILLGAALLAVGYVGVFFGRLIKAAVSRQREYLADAAAVQFTRNNLGIGGALEKILLHSTGSRIDNPNAETLSHLYFGAGLRSGFSALLATHPPLEKRIQRILPNWRPGWRPDRPATAHEPEPPPEPTPDSIQDAMPESIQSLSVAPGQVLQSIGNPGAEHLAYAATLHRRIPGAVAQALRTTTGASALLLGLAIDPRASPADRQLARLRSRVDPALLENLSALLSVLATLDRRLRLPVFDLCLPVLKTLPRPRRKELLEQLGLLIGEDERIDLDEFVIHALARRHLSPTASGIDRLRYRYLRPLLPDARLLLGALAGAGPGEQATRERAFAAGCQALDDPQPGPLAQQPCQTSALDSALSRLRSLALMPRMQVINACAATVLADGSVALREAEILRAICDTLDCPLPPLLPPTGGGTTRPHLPDPP